MPSPAAPLREPLIDDRPIPLCHVGVVQHDVVAVAGCLDETTTELLRTVLFSALRSGRAFASQLDLTRTTAVDQEAVRLIYDAAAVGLRSVVVRAGSNVEQVVRISGLSRVLRLRAVPATPVPDTAAVVTCPPIAG
jgi:hypothetical protein